MTVGAMGGIRNTDSSSRRAAAGDRRRDTMKPCYRLGAPTCRVRAERGSRFSEEVLIRHTWATWHAQGGTPGLTLQALGGWRDARMVRHYTHLAGLDLMAHANAIRVPAINRTNFAQSDPAAESSNSQAVEKIGVADGIRTHNNWNHNPGLYR